MESEMENELGKRPFLLICLGTAIAIALVGIHAGLIYLLWETAGWPLTSSKYLTGIIILVVGGVMGLAIIGLSLIALRSRDNLALVRTLSWSITILCFIGGVMAVVYGIIAFGYVDDFPTYSEFFIGRATCLLAAAGALSFSVIKAIQVTRLVKPLL